MPFEFSRFEIKEMGMGRKYLPFSDKNEDPSYHDISSANSKITILNASLEDDDTVKVYRELLEIAKILSKVMPKPSDESLFEIDDVLYENYKVSQLTEYSSKSKFCNCLAIKEYNECSKKIIVQDPYSPKSKFLDCLAITEYNECYKKIIDKGYYDHELDTIYVRLAENLGEVYFTWIFWNLGWSRDVKKICLFLKIFVSCLKVSSKNIGLKIIEDYTDQIGFSFFLIKLQQFSPSGGSSEINRIAKFIVKQAGACLKYFKKDTDLLQEPKKFIEYSMVYFGDLNEEWPSYYQYVLLDVFLSAKGMDERKEFLKVFLKALYEKGCGNRTINGVFNQIFRSLSRNLIKVAKHIVDYCEEDMRSIDQEYGYDIEPYWSECVSESPKDAMEHEKVNIFGDVSTTDSLRKTEHSDIVAKPICDYAVTDTQVPQYISRALDFSYNIEPFWSECVESSVDFDIISIFSDIEFKDDMKHAGVNIFSDVSTTDSLSKTEHSDIVEKYVCCSDVDTGSSERVQYDDFIKNIKLQCDAEYYLSKYPAYALRHPFHKSGVNSFTMSTYPQQYFNSDSYSVNLCKSGKYLTFLSNFFNKSVMESVSNNIDQQGYDCSKSSFENLQVKVIDSNIFKKFFVYDDIMKCLHLMSILHTAFTKYEVLCEDEGFHKDSDKPPYYSDRYSCTRITEDDMLFSDLKNKKVSWPLEMAISKCPFLYLKPSACHLNMHYLKSLKGEDIDKAVQKELLYCYY